jgi:chlorobactene glucosyltransferase
LNDHSTDRTGAILSALGPGDGRLRVLAGADLPPGWLGKHWACQQLADTSDGALLLFTDADTRHGPQSVLHGVAALEAEGADLLTAIPHEETVTLAERLIVPVLPWAFSPFCRWPSPTAAPRGVGCHRAIHLS